MNKPDWQKFQALKKSVTWVRGVATTSAAYGVAIVKGKLSRVAVDIDGVNAESISVREAAAMMQTFPAFEINLLLDMLSSDEGTRAWNDEIIALCDSKRTIVGNPKN